MAINNISFVLGQGALGRTLPGQDYISGYVIYSNTMPTGFTASVGKQIFSVASAESLGIVGDYSDETKATATLTATTVGSVGDIITINITEPSVIGPKVVSISYTRQASDSTATLLAASVANAINASGTGYAASSSAAVITLTNRPGLGASLNSGTPIAIVLSGTAAVTVTSQFAGGIASNSAIWHYQISEFFRMQPNGILWVGFFPTSDATQFNSISTLQAQASGAVRQFMVSNTTSTTSGMLQDIDKIQAQGIIMFNNYTPASIIYSPNLYSTTDLSTLPNTRAKSDNYVSVLIGQDSGGLGAMLSLTQGKSVTCLGACLGALALANVNEDIAWVAKFNISDGTEDEVVGFLNGQTWNTLYGISKSMLVQLDNYGYIFLKKLNNISGSFFNDSHCAISVTSDYAYIENNRTIDKAIRNAYLELSPLVMGPVYFNTDGTLSDVSISAFENSAKPSLDAMVANGELSGYSITVDANQNVQATGTVAVTIKLLGVGVARQIVVNIGYTLSL